MILIICLSCRVRDDYVDNQNIKGRHRARNYPNFEDAFHIVNYLSVENNIAIKNVLVQCIKQKRDAGFCQRRQPQG